MFGFHGYNLTGQLVTREALVAREGLVVMAAVAWRAWGPSRE